MAKKKSQHRLFLLEHHKQELLPRHLFVRRLFITISICFLILAIWILGGMAGYHFLGQLTWIDSFLNSAMIVGGMGPVNALISPDAKIFAGIYAILSGVIFLVVFGLLIAPIFHRLLHKFHLDVDDVRRSKNDSPAA